MKFKDAGSMLQAELLIFMHILPMNMSYRKRINDHFSRHAVDVVLLSRLPLALNDY